MPKRSLQAHPIVKLLKNPQARAVLLWLGSMLFGLVASAVSKRRRR